MPLSREGANTVEKYALSFCFCSDQTGSQRNYFQKQNLGSNSHCLSNNGGQCKGLWHFRSETIRGLPSVPSFLCSVVTFCINDQFSALSWMGIPGRDDEVKHSTRVVGAGRELIIRACKGSPSGSSGKVNGNFRFWSGCKLSTWFRAGRSIVQTSVLQ